MLDSRIYTFLELSNELNYHKTAENLHITQPAVTQHIHYLEDYYGCELFTYSNRKLSLTPKGMALEKYARTLVATSLSIKESLSSEDVVSIKIGATKTISDYLCSNSLLNNFIVPLVSDVNINVDFISDNTQNLLNMLNHFELDLLLLEGYIDKSSYPHSKLSDREIIGICSNDHPFANKMIAIEDVFNENVLLREHGSGSRKVFENFLAKEGYPATAFKNSSIISSNKLIEKMVEGNVAISFVYDIIAEQNPNLSTFRFKNKKIMHEFTLVYLNEAKAKMFIDKYKLY